jgi:prepilin-type N-terminal cleavage/methylation domain-containing protein/prepilin-type processing-associated H-X9-DG protein
MERAERPSRPSFVVRRDSQWSSPAVRPRRAGFTLVELLVVIGIIGVLISILLPALGKAREQSNTTKCAANLRSIGQAFQIYLNTYNQFTPPFKNNTTLLEPADPTQYIDANHPDAYWGVFMAVAGRMPKEIFTCPSNLQKNDSAGYPNQYTAYGYNAWGNAISGMSDADRLKFFGSLDEIALLRKNAGSWDNAIGRRITRLRHATQTILAQDAWEAALDGGNNGDTFASSDPGKRGQLTEYPGHDIEYLRHTRTSNAVFVDGHVERLDKDDQTDERYYTGSWGMARSY